LTSIEPIQRRRRGKGMSPAEVRARYPSLQALTQPSGRASKKAWIAVFNARPDAMHSLLADFIKQVHATPGRIGQRPMPREQEVDFHSLVYGEENEEPLTVVLPRLITISERAFATKIHMSRTQVQRLLTGDYDPDVYQLCQIAAAVKKPPTFFVEYRKAMAVAAFLSLIDARPGIATTLYRQYLEVRMGEDTQPVKAKPAHQ
jgi:transcriptional regulator with XRE-family HTH domain